ncbi:hypothetical protein [Bradyrhizobium japonicum]|uniref:hypothetical protein n=1 Tax=Bradyrhizobium japonicum TaxID=375 RepID=UPI0020A0A8BE|nr:hypothetical protein [Bradyrhizobium japonicum]MCP1774738.1 hypothetical protein [Bradyrhizobium japonicum]MCP1962262.1 hypothetical protein [Bradyrhizobium japonicum]
MFYFSRTNLLFTVFFAITLLPTQSNGMTLSKTQTDALIYDDYQRYKLSQKNDYSSILDKQYAITLIQRNPKISEKEVLLEVQRSQAERRELISTVTNGYKLPTTINSLGDAAVGLGTLLSGSKVGPYVGVGAKLLLDAGKSYYESTRTPEARFQAEQGLYSARKEGEALIAHVNDEARKLRSKNPVAASVLDKLDTDSIGASMRDSQAEITKRDAAYGSVLDARNITKRIGPNGSLSVEIDDIKKEGEQITALITKSVSEGQKKAADEAEHRARLANYDTMESGLLLVTNLLQMDGKTAKFGAQLSAAGSTALSIGRSIENFRFSDKGSGQSLKLTFDVVNAAMALAQALDSQPTFEQIALEQISQIREFLESFKKEMHERFDRVDLQLNTIWNRLTTGLDKLQSSAHLASIELANIRAELFALGDRMGRFESRVMWALGEKSREEIALAVDEIVRSTSPAKYADFERVAIRLANFARSSVNSPPFVISEPLTELSVDEQVTAFSGVATTTANRPAFKSSGLGAIGPAINLIDQAARVSDKPQDPLLASPEAWVFSADQFVRLWLAQSSKNRDRLKKDIIEDIVGPGVRLSKSIDGVLGKRNDTSEVGKAHSLLAALLESYRKEVETFREQFQKLREEFSAQELKGVSFWKSRDEVLNEEATRPLFSPPNEIPTCSNISPYDIVEGAFRDQSLGYPPGYEKSIDPIFAIAKRLNLLQMDFCHHGDILSMTGFPTYRVAASVSNVAIADQMMPMEEPLAALGLGTVTELWNKKYRDRFGKESKPEDFIVHKMTASVSYQFYLSNCTPLTEPPKGQLESDCKKWASDPYAKPLWFDRLSTPAYQRNELKQAVLDKVSVALINARSKFAEDAKVRLRSTLFPSLRKITLAKQRMLAVLSLGYSHRISEDDDLRSIFFGTEQLFDEHSLLAYLDDPDAGVRAVILDKEFDQRMQTSKSIFSQLEPNRGLPGLQRMLASLDKMGLH